MPATVTHAPVYVLDLEDSIAFYTEHLGFEVLDDVSFGPAMRWLTVGVPGSGPALLLAAIDHHVAEVDRPAMKEVVTKGNLAVFVHVDDVDATFERLRTAGAEVLQEPTDAPYGVRDCGVRDPSGNHLRVSMPLRD